MNKHCPNSSHTEERRRIERLMVEGYKSSSEENKANKRDWEPADLEKWD